MSTCPIKPINTAKYRLPTNLKPYSYELEIKPYIGNFEMYQNKSFTFTGIVKIYFSCIEQTNEIVLHSKGLNITSVRLSINRNNVETTGEFAINTENDFLTIYTRSMLQINTNYSIMIEFNGLILDKLYGFYRSSYYSPVEEKTY